MAVILQIAFELCMCCKSTAHHDPARGKSVSDYGTGFDKKEYAEQGQKMKRKIPDDWNCGKCHRKNLKGIEYCIYCDNRYRDIYRITAITEEKQGEDSHVDIAALPRIEKVVSASTGGEDMEQHNNSNENDDDDEHIVYGSAAEEAIEENA